ncbi:flagellar filament capping protein FliD [Virgibacillus halophilus]|uniref:Flagellar filament capping protein FliD n=2 Tax=Tigheibacillus halophilus TaxID=361280 RepID=A0ABU5C1R3_9BACI|nr:flagellar filament capping protein FliD [Virgibacillus halophilus]
MKVGKVAKEIDFEKPLGKAYNFSITTYDKDGKAQEHSFQVSKDETLKDVFKRVNSEAEGMRLFYDEQSGQVVMETTYTGIRHKDEAGNQASEMEFEMDNPFFSEVLNIDATQGKKAQNAQFTYNDNLKLESQENSYKLNGITYEFKNTTPEGPVTLTVTNDVDSAFDKIKAFVDKYNEVVEKLNGTQTEDKYRNYQPLTEEQKKEMSEKEIELWEEKAKSGIIKGESIISNGLFSMRQGWYAPVKNDGPFTSLTEIGIKTTSNYLDGGKLEINEDKLKEMLREDPAAVQKLFSNSSEGEGRGLVNRLEDALESTIKNIENRAGKSTSTMENYTIGKSMKDLNARISDFQKRLQDIETRYWNQFTAMEKAISNMNSQANQLMSQFGQ